MIWGTLENKIKPQFLAFSKIVTYDCIYIFDRPLVKEKITAVFTRFSEGLFAGLDKGEFCKG